MRFQALLFLIFTLALTTFALPNGLPEYKDNGWGPSQDKWSPSKDTNKGFGAPKNNKPDSHPSFPGQKPHQVSNPWKPEPEPHNPWKPEPHPQPPFHPEPPINHQPQPTLSWTAAPTMTWAHLPTQSVKPYPWKRNLDHFEPYQPGHMASVTRQPWQPTPTSYPGGGEGHGNGWGNGGDNNGWGQPGHGQSWPKPEPKPEPGWGEPHKGGITWGEPSGNNNNNNWGEPHGNGFGGSKTEEQQHGRAMNNWKRDVLEA